MDFLSNAKLNIVEINKNVLVFERKNSMESVLIIVNRSENKIDVSIPEQYLTGEVIFKSNYDNNQLLEYGFLVIEQKEN